MLYKIDSTKVTLREWSWYGGFLSGLIGKIFRIQQSSSTDEPPIDSIANCEVSEESLPEAVREAFAPARAELEALGFHSPVFHCLWHPITSTQYYWASFLHNAGDATARLTFRYWSKPIPPRTNVYTSYVSGFGDGSYLVSTSSKPDMLAPPQVTELRVKGAAATPLWQAHLGELSRLKAKKEGIKLDSPEELRRFLENFQQCISQFHVRRGVFAEPTAADLAQLAALQQAREQAQQTGSAFPEIHAEIEALQQKQSSWTSAIVLLVISLLIFAGAGGARWDWKFALMIIPILFFHELGHYVAMRIFKYRNLKMFFIPLFGAAVTGSHYNVPGWKKVIVSLMGPLPGILLAIPVAAVGLYLHKESITSFAMLMVVLNGFNLLPILPLDGGWIMHNLLFSRHYILDFVFRVVAVIGLGVWGMTTTDKFMFYLSIFMAIGLPAAFKMARISSKLRKEELPQMSADDQTIPFLTAERIIGEVKEAFPKGLTTKTAAQNTLSIFETINARPPGWVATIFYLSLHVASFAVAFILLGVLVLGKRGELGALAGNQGGPRLPVSCEQIVSGQRDTIPGNGQSYQTFVATFKTGAKARKQFEAITNLTSSSAQSKLFGRTVLVSYPESDHNLREQLTTSTEKSSTNYFIQSTNLFTQFVISCVAPDEATANLIEAETEQYLDGAGGMSLLPVWLPNQPLSGEELKKAQAARRTYHKLRASTFESFTNAALTEIYQQVTKAKRRGDNATVKKLNAEAKEVEEKLKNERIGVIESEPGADKEIVKLHREWPYLFATNDVQKAIQKQIRQKMGEMKMEGEKPVAEQAVYAARWGYISRENLKLHFSVTLENTYYGAPALTQWLCNHGCKEMKYAFIASSFEGETGDDER